MLTKTEAVVIKSMKYGDTSKIVTFYTRQFGTLKGIAKGARKAGNKFGASLEPFSRVMLVVYKKENRDLHLISQCDTIDAFLKLNDTLERLSAGMAVLELVDQLAHSEEEHPELYQLLVQTLATLSQTDKNHQSLRRAFQLRCASLFGFAPALEVCSECGKSLLGEELLSSVGFKLASGALVCEDCRRDPQRAGLSVQTTVSAPTLRLLQKFSSWSTEQIPSISYHESVGNELDETLRLYFRYHFDHARELRSVRLFKSINQM